jgi:hypothetical protein
MPDLTFVQRFEIKEPRRTPSFDGDADSDAEFEALGGGGRGGHAWAEGTEAVSPKVEER